MSTIFEEATHQSPGHIAVEYTRGFPASEWYEYDGMVVRAPLHNAIDADGYRIGRWECTRAYFDTKHDYLTQRFDLR